VTKTFETGYTALRDVDFAVEPERFVALVGPSGCGKSTTLSLISGLDRVSSGVVEVRGKPVDGITGGIGFLFQRDALMPWKTVRDNVLLPLQLRGVPRKAALDRAAEWIARVGLRGFEASFPHQLSGGMRKRVSLAQTLVYDPEILLMDEPFSALDVQTRVLMHEELLRLWSEAKASVVFVTHDLEEAIALADKVYVLTAGPATVKSVYTIDLPRPRVVADIRYEQSFIDYSRTIWADLKEEVETSYARAAA
jgi:NitT/TauT family transport system ATP-binding protein